MRPHRLRLTAFGAFARTVEVDLDALSAGGLFLLRGDTGAGKTTLLDALGFALYGQVPGVRQKTRRLRSDHAAPDLRTSVQLEVSLGGRRLRITRSPQQERRKTRGEGTTTEPAKVVLEERLDGGWVVLSTRIDEAAAELDPLLGMTAPQFFQVVLLPQGEFAQFLRADSDKRGELLEKLFGTARFGAAEDWLQARRRDCTRDVAVAKAAVDVLLARVAQAASASVPAPEFTTGAELALWAKGLLAGAADVRQGAVATRSRAEQARDLSRQADELATALAGRQARRAALLAASRALGLGASAAEVLQDELASATRAAGLAGLLREQRGRAQDRRAAHEAQDDARRTLPAHGLAVDLDLAGLRREVAVGRERTGRLGSLRAVVADLAAERAQVAAAQADAAAAAGTAELARSRLEQAADLRSQLLPVLAAGRAAAVALPGVLAEQAVVAGRLRDVAARGLARSRAAELAGRLLTARETAVALKEHAQQVREARFEANVFELASLLVEGDPCMVCGSSSHPDPSEVRGELVGREQEDAARAAAEGAAREVADLAVEVAAERAVEGDLDERLAGVVVGQLRPLQAALITRADELAEAAAGVPGTSARLQQLDDESGPLAAARAAAQAAVEAADRRRREATQRAERAAGLLAAELAAGVARPPSTSPGPDAELVARLDRELAAVGTRVSAAERLLLLDEAARQADVELDRADSALAEAVAAAGFRDDAAARAAVRDPAWHGDAELRLRARADELAAVAAGLADPELDVPLVPAAQVTASSAALARADGALTAAVAAAATATSRFEALAELVPQLLASLDSLGPQEQTAAEVRRLADLCAGDGQNALRMSLSSFVLAARLEEVAAEASTRLLRMTQGRYTLVHTDATGRGGVRSGLGLLARDAWTGHDRDTSTLSGGETFLASLALALGLADVVSAEAGGARLEALFVDEGFGSLDEDTLDEVMDVLDGLREGGRVVGVVSHVAELHQRIQAQVHVRKTRTGSDLVLLGC